MITSMNFKEDSKDTAQKKNVSIPLLYRYRKSLLERPQSTDKYLTLLPQIFPKN